MDHHGGAWVNVNNQIKIFKISDCFMADPILTYDPALDSLFMPSQTFTCITPNDTLPHTFVGKGKIIPRFHQTNHLRLH